VTELTPGRCRYGFLLNDVGGVIDDLICIQVSPDRFMIVGNAGRRDEDAGALRERVRAEFCDASDDTAKLDLQGPRAAEVLQPKTDVDLGELGYFCFAHATVAGIECILSRTGYTGELGYELYVPAEAVGELWNRLLEMDPVKPAGLGARDLLRLEMGYPLYGHEWDEQTTPVEARYAWALPGHTEYTGAEAVTSGQRREPDRLLVGVRFEGRRAAREGAALLKDNEDIGRVTSGSFSPALECAIALGYVKREHAEPGTGLQARVRDKLLEGSVVTLPFYDGGTVTREVSETGGLR
jgi:aminomethyltransferase